MGRGGEDPHDPVFDVGGDQDTYMSRRAGDESFGAPTLVAQLSTAAPAPFAMTTS